MWFGFYLYDLSNIFHQPWSPYVWIPFSNRHVKLQRRAPESFAPMQGQFQLKLWDFGTAILRIPTAESVRHHIVWCVVCEWTGGQDTSKLYTQAHVWVLIWNLHGHLWLALQILSGYPTRSFFTAVVFYLPRKSHLKTRSTVTIIHHH